MAAPKRVQIADDALSADSAYRLACAGTGLLWRGDFQNARQLLQALARRIDRPRKVKRKPAGTSEIADNVSPFHLHRQTQSQRARTLGMLLVQVEADRSIALRRAPDWSAALRQAWGEDGGQQTTARVVPLRELLGVVGAYEWRKNGIEIAALGAAPKNRIHPHYGVYSPVRGEYLDLIAAEPLPADPTLAFDIGCGTGVIAALLARRGIARVTATDVDARAIRCALDNLDRLGLREQVEVLQGDLFPPGRAPLVVCNPPWLPARAAVPIELAIYDEDSRMLRGFLEGLGAHLSERGEGWLILSDLAEHLQLRSRAELLGWIEAAGLVVLGQRHGVPHHPKVNDVSDPLHEARAKERTTLWRLGVAAAGA
ncbi:MAG: class I SAM-dependent methyltransferase [Burkholderiales bacterium]